MNGSDAAKAAAIVRDAGGHIVGRTRLQKIAYILSVIGFEDEFSFSYKHFGPFSGDLAKATRYASSLGLLNETEKKTSWGGSYSIYTCNEKPRQDVPPGRVDLVKCAADAGAVELELTATALFLAMEDHSSPWVETERRKPEKSEDGRIDGAKALYEKLTAINTPNSWPVISQ